MSKLGISSIRFSGVNRQKKPKSLAAYSKYVEKLSPEEKNEERKQVRDELARLMAMGLLI